MADSSSTAQINAAAVAAGQRRRVHPLIKEIPAYLYIIIGYLLLEWAVGDVRTVFFVISWVELLYIVGFVVACLELLKVARPGEDNTDDVIIMIIMAVAYLILCFVSVTNTGWLSFFNYNHREFYVL